MSIYPTRPKVMIAPAGDGGWARELAETLGPLDVEVQWTRSDRDAVGLATTLGMHLAVVDVALPATGGLDVLRRLRHLGVCLPCLLVGENPSERLLYDALALDAFSVLDATVTGDLLAPMVFRFFRRQYQIELFQNQNQNQNRSGSSSGQSRILN